MFEFSLSQFDQEAGQNSHGVITTVIYYVYYVLYDKQTTLPQL